jgi:ubiquinone/menaquinone biosynthesis C-methylase UbiE
MNLAEYRASPEERNRTRDLLRLTPPRGRTALDVGARDGHFYRVIALDLSTPTIEHAKVECVQGNAAELQFPDGSIDFPLLCRGARAHSRDDLADRL